MYFVLGIDRENTGNRAGLPLFCYHTTSAYSMVLVHRSPVGGVDGFQAVIWFVMVNFLQRSVASALKVPDNVYLQRSCGINSVICTFSEIEKWGCLLHICDWWSDLTVLPQGEWKYQIPGYPMYKKFLTIHIGVMSFNKKWHISWSYILIYQFISLTSTMYLIRTWLRVTRNNTMCIVIIICRFEWYIDKHGCQIPFLFLSIFYFFLPKSTLVCNNIYLHDQDLKKKAESWRQGGKLERLDKLFFIAFYCIFSYLQNL